MAIIQDIIDSIKGSASETTTTVTPTATVETVVEKVEPVSAGISLATAITGETEAVIHATEE